MSINLGNLVTVAVILAQRRFGFASDSPQRMPARAHSRPLYTLVRIACTLAGRLGSLHLFIYYVHTPMTPTRPLIVGLEGCYSCPLCQLTRPHPQRPVCDWCSAADQRCGVYRFDTGVAKPMDGGWNSLKVCEDANVCACERSCVRGSDCQWIGASLCAPLRLFFWHESM